MTIIVKHLKTGNEYLLIGTGFSSSQSLNLPFLRGNPVIEKDSIVNQMVALCDQNGKIFWVFSAEVIVTEIDGKNPSELLEGKITSTIPLTGEPQEGTWEDSEDDEDWV